MDTEGPPNSRLFLVCGKSADEELLAEAFQPFGHLQGIKLLRDKGVAYVKYDKASSAAAALESLHEAVLSDGRTKLKVMLAEAPNTRRVRHRPSSDVEAVTDPDNVPPRSRLFVVVPKNANSGLIQEELARWPDLQYCKTDLIATKGVVFCKFSRSSSALRTLEAVTDSGQLAGYKVKCMLAEPKSKRGRTDSGGGSLDNTSWQGDRGAVVSPSTSGSRGAVLGGASSGGLDQSGPYRETRPPFQPSHGISPVQSRSFTSTYSEGGGRSLTSAQSTGIIGMGGTGDCSVLNTLGGIAQLSNLAAAANFAQGAVLASQALGTQGFAGQGHQPSSFGGSQQMFASQAISGGNSGGNPPIPGLTATQTQALASHLQQQQQQQQQLGSQSGAQQRLTAHSQGASDGPLNNLAARSQVGLGGATGLGLGIGSGPPLTTTRGLEALSLGNLMGTLHPLGQQPSHAAQLSSAGSMSVCTTSGLRSSEPLNRQRLFVVCHKAATEDMLARLFRTWPGLEYLDLKRDRATGASKGFSYVNYSSREAAAAALDTLNGIEWPPASGARLKVMYAEPLGSRRPPLPAGAAGAARPAPSDSLESAAHGVASPPGDDETSSRHRPLPALEDPVLPSPMRFPLPSSIAEEVGPGLYGDYCQPGIIGSAPQAPHDSHIAVHVASAAMHDTSDAGEQHIAIQTASAAMDEGAAPRDLQRRHQMDQQLAAAQQAHDRLQAEHHLQYQQQQQQLQQAIAHQEQLQLLHMQQAQAQASGHVAPSQQQQPQPSFRPDLLPLHLHAPPPAVEQQAGDRQQQSGQVQQSQQAQQAAPEGGRTGRKQAAAAAPTTSDMNWESADSPGAEERRLYTTLPRPLPDYALAHVFAQYGPVDFVRLQSDARHGVVQFASAESAAAALAGLAGSDICGQALALSPTDPLQPERNSKRPRMAP